MAAGTFEELYDTANNLIDEARKLGLTEAKPVTIVIQGYAEQENVLARRKVTVSYTKPAVPDLGIELWCDVTARKIYKSNLETKQWELVHMRDKMLSDQ